MAINIFLGARRIAILIGAIAFITFLFAIKYGTFGYPSYSLAAPDAPFKKVWFDEWFKYECPREGKNISFYVKPNLTSGGGKSIITVCLEPMTFTNEENSDVELIPYLTDGEGTLWGTKSNAYTTNSESPELSKYIKEVEKRFVAEEAEIMWRNQLAEAVGYFATLLVIYAAFVFAVGWIVRGLLGIPHGMDERRDFSTKISAPPAEMDIIKSEKLKQYSVADELLKWAKLKEDGHITEEEFNEARKKMLKQN